MNRAFHRVLNTRRVAVVLTLGFAVILALGVSTPANAQSSMATASAAKIEDHESFAVIGVSVRTSHWKEAGGNGEIPNMWSRAMQDGTFDRIPNRADHNIVAVYTDYTSNQNGEYTYILGARVTSTDKVPDGFVTVTIPAGKYAVVQTDKGALPDVMPKVWQRIYAMPAKELGGERAFKTDYEVYPEGFDWQNAQIDLHLGLK
ncbi:MAG TPA: GyrI-like domain-containing protein [Silvibacterium sp.]|nr:GyrI-like domain-containing protein [Silvibacterium sp.]